MNREIKFRGQREFNGTDMVYGNYAYVNEQHWIIPFNDYESESELTDDWVLVIPETVGEFTGLLDKNGVEIYEGDIVSIGYRHQKERYTRIVEWHQKDCCYRLKIKGSYDFNLVESMDHEVIGNIYETQLTNI